MEEALAEVDLVFHLEIFLSFGQSLYFRMEMASLTEMVSIINGNGEQDGIVSMVEMVCTMKIVE